MPAFVQEAYSLLKSSIIHVEQEDIDFDDADIDAEIAAADAAEAADTQQQSSSQANGTPFDDPSTPTPHQNGATPQQLAATPQPQTQQQKRKMRITHDKYTTMQELIVLHVASVEQQTGTGVERTKI